ncbi:FAD-dependent monooxygenase [Amycolatopsis sp. A133]|nr:FAD-dependent monooxygenase [Amycolatopsis sp. A133]MDQ7809100.1 FAD-dependent monooxygenase [Amycolatopsis sp. A133]
MLPSGDAAYRHPPIGGRGRNLGLQDAMKLGRKPGLVACGLPPECLLDTYPAERHPVGEPVLRNRRAQVALKWRGLQAAVMRMAFSRCWPSPLSTATSSRWSTVPTCRAPPRASVTSPPCHCGGGAFSTWPDRPEIRSAAAGCSGWVQTTAGSVATHGDPAGLLIRPEAAAPGRPRQLTWRACPRRSRRP